MQQQYSKIPVPAKTRWREFRIKIIPLLLFGVAILVVSLLWEKRVQTPDFIGKVTAESAVITAPSDGILKKFDIEDFKNVEAGQELAVISRASETELEARKNLIQQEILYIRQSLSPIQTSYRAFIDFKGMQFDLLERQLELSSLRTDSVYIGLEFERTEALYRNGLTDQQNFERIKSRKEMNHVRIEEIRRIIATIQPQLDQLDAFTTISSADFNASVDAAIGVQESELELAEQLFGEISVRSPLSGVFRKKTNKISGFVSKGDTLAVVEARMPEYIIGYVRQPFSVRPEPGMEVEIRSRGIGQNRYRATINEVGAHIHPILPDLRRPGLTHESGLPVKVNLDAEFHDAFIPGEIVDLILL